MRTHDHPTLFHHRPPDLCPTWRQAFIIMHKPHYIHDRAENVWMSAIPALGIALFWPLAMIVVPMYFWVARPTPGERQKALEERERDLRREAQRLGLPWSEDTDTSGGLIRK